MTNRHPVSSDSNDLAEQAAFWCMRLHDEDCTTEERAEFERWLVQDPAHAAEYRSMVEIWDVSALLPRRIEPRKTALPRATWWQRFATAAIVIVLTGLHGWHQGWLPTSFQHVSAGPGLRTVRLADGSEVELNRKTSLLFLNFRDRRLIRLNDGEAFFHVRHDAEHPFEVIAGNGRIVVTGTKFNVWHYQDNVTVTLTEGSVKVLNERQRPNPSATFLSPGQQISFGDNNAQLRIVQVDPRAVLAWRENRLVLNDLSLREALPLINRYLDEPIFLADNTVGNLRIGGVFNTDNVHGLIKNLPKVLPVQLTQKPDGRTIIERRASL